MPKDRDGSGATKMRLLSPAKINLFLYVTGKRPDGYHTVETFLCGISLYDGITLSFGENKDLACRCNHPDVPSGPANLAHRAATLYLKCLAQNSDYRLKSVAIDIDKRIPVGAGLGGGSSNAATVLLGLNRHFGNPLSKETLLSLGASLGADVPFFIHGGPAMAGGIGTEFEPVPPIRPFRVVLVYPGVAVSTAAVYKNLNLGLTNREKENKKSLFDGSSYDPAACLHNDLEASAILLCPDILPVKSALLAAGANGVLMTGSGSAVFGVFFDRRRAAAALQSISRQYDRWQVFSADALV